MSELRQTPYEVLLGRMDGVLAEWRELVRHSSLNALPPARLMDALPDIFPRLVRLARSGATEVDDDLKAYIAGEHGVVRREESVPVTTIADEWEALKRACARVLAREGFVGESAERAQRRIDILIDDAIGYTLRGYYEPELNTLRGRGLERRETPVEDRRRGGDRRERNGDDE